MAMHRRLVFASLCSLFVLPVFSQSDRPIAMQFQWKFANDGLGSQLPTCLPLGIIVQSWNIHLNDTFGIPPYYMIAWAIGGTPQTTFIGTENRTLSYTVAHPPGTELMLNVVDSTGSGGGIPPRLFEVITGATLQCVTPDPIAPEFTVTANKTTELETCEPWGLTIKGGNPPYNLSLAAVNSPFVTNVTIPFGFDAFTYINRAAPNGQLIAAISDLSGRWATGTPLINTFGSTDDECPGRGSASGNSTLLGHNRSGTQPSAAKNTALIAGVTISLLALLIGAAGFVFWYYRRKKHSIQQTEKAIMDPQGQGPPPVIEDYLPSGPPSKVTYSPPRPAAIMPFDITIVAAETYGSLSTKPRSVPRRASTQISEGAPFAVTSPIDLVSETATSETSSTRSRVRPSFNAFPSTPTRRSKTSEGHMSSYSAAQDIIIQHRDGGMVRELPPPYADSRAQEKAVEPEGGL